MPANRPPGRAWKALRAAVKELKAWTTMPISTRPKRPSPRAVKRTIKQLESK